MTAIAGLFDNELFWCGFIGAGAVEVVALFKAWRRGCPPKRVRSIGFWLLWLCVCFLGGWLAAVVVPANPQLIATITGASVVLLVQRFSQRPLP